MRSAVVVGGSTGIGAAVADLLGSDGWSVGRIDRTHGVAVEDRSRFGRALRCHLPADAVVYCAGHVSPGPLADVDLCDWDHTLEVNLTGAFRTLQAVAAAGRPCAVILVGSTAGTRPSPLWAAYAASKAALSNLAQTAQDELGPLGVRTYVVNPGRTATALRARLAPDEDASTIMQPHEVAEVIVSLLADTAGVLAGSPIQVRRS